MSMNNPVFAMYEPGAHMQTILAAIRARETGKIEAAGVESSRASKEYRSFSGVAVVDINGPMLRGIGADVARWFGMTDTAVARNAVAAAASDGDADAIVLRVNSPGGSVDGLAELAETINAAKQKKPVVAFVDGMAASAAYYAASAANGIYANRMDLIGSIGTRMTVYDYSEAFARNGVKVHALATGEHKAAGEYGTEVTDSQLAEFQRIVDGYFDDFAAQVKRGRSMTDEKFNAVADGRVFFAPDAQRRGLVDGISTFSEVIAGLNAASDAKRRFAAV
jgi:signal peptide peptidase SppA